MRKSKCVLVIGVVSILAIVSCSRTPMQSSPITTVPVKVSSDPLSQIEPFIRQALDKTEVFDESGAQAAKLDDGTLRTARELVALNNQIVAAAGNGQEFESGVQEYQLLNAAFAKLTQEGLGGQSNLWIGCGNPIFPSACPARTTSRQVFATDPKVRAALVTLGYHYTASYAGQSGNDYTMTVANSCWPSSFRSQAIVTKSGANWTYSTQSPEPNPEILGYIWPYAWWGPYVYWWHHWYC